MREKIYKITPYNGSEPYYMIAVKKHWWSPYELQPHFWRYEDDGKTLYLCEYASVNRV